MNMFYLGLGNIDGNLFYESHSPLFACIVFIFAFISVTVAMTGYIAYICDSYRGIKENQPAIQRYQKAKNIVNYLKVMNERKREAFLDKRKYFFALVPVDDAETIDAKMKTVHEKTSQRPDEKRVSGSA